MDTEVLEFAMSFPFEIYSIGSTSDTWFGYEPGNRFVTREVNNQKFKNDRRRRLESRG